MTASPLMQLVAVTCAACGRPLTDALSAQLAMGPDCRQQYGYVLDGVSFGARDEANRIMHTIAGNYLAGDNLRLAIFRLSELGFNKVAQRIERRLGRWIAQTMAAAAQAEFSFDAPAAVPEEPIKLDLPFALTEGQDRARELVGRLRKAKGFAVGFVVGFAGTGKTTALKVFAAEHGTPIVITPTGRAALRVREATGLKASTIHRWLYKPIEDEKTGAVKFTRSRAEDLAVPQSRMVLLDEASMVGPDVWKDVRNVCEQRELKLVVVGDGFQLPPVQAPNAPPFSVLLPEFAASLGAERVEMTEVVRQAQGSPVIRASMALRNGEGVRALRDLQRVETAQLRDVVTAVHKAGGVTICHRNVTRYSLNAGIRQTLGIFDEMPQVGEPLLCLKNTYEAGIVNGEAFSFEGWIKAQEDGDVLRPDMPEMVYDRYKDVRETVRFGATQIGKVKVSLALEELHGRLTVGQRPLLDSAAKWARLQNLFSNDALAPHVSANFGYAYTAHKAQGSQWPFVLVVLEPSVRLDQEEGRRWAYTAITRAQQQAALHYGRV